MPEVIGYFRDNYAFLSNFYSSPYIITFKPGELVICPTVEHEFQMGKTPYLTQRRGILEAPTPGIAKKLGRTVTLDPLWDQEKEEWMYGCLWHKFSQNVELAHKLMSTGDAVLVEGNHWHDNYWGICDCTHCMATGKNRLGQLLQLIRTRLQGIFE